jgi:hypothetical protein
MGFILLVIGILVILILLDLAISLFIELDQMLNYTIPNCIKKLYNAGSKIVKTILHKNK